MTCFILIPAYNEAQLIGEVIAGLAPLGHRMVVIDDGSRDGTAQAAQAKGAMVLRHCVNLGQGAALQTGLDYARAHGAHTVVTFDADGQHVPADITRLLEMLEAHNADVVLGSRFLGEARNIRWLRKTLLRLMVHYTNATTGLKLTDVHNGLRALRVDTTRAIQLKQNRMAHASELLQQIARHKLRYTEIPCTIIYTPYSLAKGQKLYHAVYILADLLMRRMHK